MFFIVVALLFVCLFVCVVVVVFWWEVLFRVSDEQYQTSGDMDVGYVCRFRLTA